MKEREKINFLFRGRKKAERLSWERKPRWCNRAHEAHCYLFTHNLLFQNQNYFSLNSILLLTQKVGAWTREICPIKFIYNREWNDIAVNTTNPPPQKSQRISLVSNLYCFPPPGQFCIFNQDTYKNFFMIPSVWHLNQKSNSNDTFWQEWWLALYDTG